MITFKKFLEAEVAPINVQHLDDVMLQDIILRHCKASLWMIKEQTPIWRGDKHARTMLGKTEVGLVDTLKSTRRSQNTSNWYTTILDNHPEYTDFPKRSQSLICTTNWTSAYKYSHNIDNVMAVIPFDSAQIGWVGAADIWSKAVNLPGGRETLRSMNDFFDALRSFGLDDSDWASFETFSVELKSNTGLQASVVRELKLLLAVDDEIADEDIKKWIDNFAEQVQNTYSNIGLTSLTPHSLYAEHSKFSKVGGGRQSFELWVGGKVLCMSNEVFERAASWIL